jgi:hypothetical protein
VLSLDSFDSVYKSALPVGLDRAVADMPAGAVTDATCKLGRTVGRTRQRVS